MEATREACKMAMIDNLRKRAAELRAQLQSVAASSPLPPASSDLERELELVRRYQAEDVARQRVAAAVGAQLAGVEAEIAEVEAAERKAKADNLAAEVEAGKRAMLAQLQSVADECRRLHGLESERYSLLGIVYHPQFPTFATRLRDDVFSHWNHELGL